MARILTEEYARKCIDPDMVSAYANLATFQDNPEHSNEYDMKPDVGQNGKSKELYSWSCKMFFPKEKIENTRKLEARNRLKV